ncbi:transmembrane protease serine 12 [Galleria mellonella]|uniref:Transmembrane protease serine 12 n=1 Tax=Galleria mellonella TaxID=7137 RepID=A0ABM3MSB3_GALME|nr:transmembrane protease serine 12 [Galleria mellonella]
MSAVKNGNSIWYQRHHRSNAIYTNTDKVLKKRKNCFYNGNINKTKWRRKSKWRLGAVLIPLIVLNFVGQVNTETLTSRVLASIFGYSPTCTIGTEVRPCTLSLTCWLQGGTRLKGCGTSWLFSCCLPPKTGSSEAFDNSIPSSEWMYNKAPPQLRYVPQRSVVPANVFRRRVDDDAAQADCGLPSSRILQKRIIGGREARFAEFPWQAHVRISEFQCGGVLVSRQYVATAAHCVWRARARDVAVWLGAHDTARAGTRAATKLGVVQKILHPLFQFRMTQPDRYDIALLKLSRPITYMSHILPICLPDFDLELQGRSGVIAGWGKTDASNSHTGTNLLRSATVPILSKEQCIKWHQSKQISVEIHSEMICAGHSDGHQDACLGDSGGPLIVLDNGRYYLAGITSAGFGCGVDHQPGIYHNVKVTSNWIRGVINPVTNYIDF